VDGTGTMFVSCFNDACEAGGGCKEGYTGSACAECMDGTILDDSYECIECPSVFITILMITGGLVLFLAYLAAKVKMKRTGEKPKLSQVYSKIIMSTLQVNAIALSYAFDWDEIMETFLSGQGQVTSLGIAYINLGCLQNNPEKNFVVETAIYGLFPVAIILMVFVVVLLTEMCRSDGHHATAEEKRSAKKLAWKHAKDDATGVAVIVLFLLQPYLVKRFALLFSCVTMGAETDTESFVFLTEDLNVQCYSSTHFMYIVSLSLRINHLSLFLYIYIYKHTLP